MQRLERSAHALPPTSQQRQNLLLRLSFVRAEVEAHPTGKRVAAWEHSKDCLEIAEDVVAIAQDLSTVSRQLRAELKELRAEAPKRSAPKKSTRKGLARKRSGRKGPARKS